MKNNYLDVVYQKRADNGYPKALVEWLHLWCYIWKGSLLDVGCGDGTFTKTFNDAGFSAIGIDYPTVDFEKDDLPFEDESFEFIFCKSVIEHVRNTDHFLSELYRVLQPGGKIVIMTPSWEHVYRDFFNDYTHVRPFHRKGLQDCMKIHDFQNVKVEYFYQLPKVWVWDLLRPLVWLTQLLPDSWKWKDKEQNIHRTWIRFSKEVMLLGIGIK
jgi:SAM-dependent methyltransferase